jgi:CRP/FNR family cyclic AMP-dependent transcriptional regulator
MHETLKNSLSGLINLSDEEWAFVFHDIKTKTTKRNELLLEKGKICQHVYFVAKGCLRIFLVDDGGQEYTRILIFEGMFWNSLSEFYIAATLCSSYSKYRGI